MVVALHCAEPAAYNAVVHRFARQISSADALVAEYFARTAGASDRSAHDRWNVEAANVWAEHAIGARQGYCADARRLFGELAVLAPGPSFLTLAERVNEGVPIRAPDACRAPGDTPAPLQPR